MTAFVTSLREVLPTFPRFPHCQPWKPLLTIINLKCCKTLLQNTKTEENTLHKWLWWKHRHLCGRRDSNRRSQRPVDPRPLPSAFNILFKTDWNSHTKSNTPSWFTSTILPVTQYKGLKTYEGISKSFGTESITKYTLTTINTHWEATQRVMAAKLTRLTYKIAIQLHLVAESCTVCSSRSRRPVRKFMDTAQNFN
jgi:hypothetical protein